jgi:uncharacterized protein DUF262
MKHSSRSQSISWFQEQYKAARLTLRPPFQRKPVWTEKQRCFLIESIRMDIPIPEIYVQVSQDDDGTESFGVVDGQQRLRTILQFVGVEHSQDQEDENNNNFSLNALPEASRFYDEDFSEVIGNDRKRFFQYEICVRLLYTEDVKDVEEVFKRLNKYVTPLKPQELRNATYHGPFAKLSETLADDEYWAVNRIVSPASIRRMADIEMMSDLLIGLIHGPQGGASKIIDQYYEEYEQTEDEFPNQTRVKRDFVRALDLIKRLLPNISETRWGNKADFYSLFVFFGCKLATHEIEASSEQTLKDKLFEFAREVSRCLEAPSAKTSKYAKSYARAIEKGSNDKARRIDRNEALAEVITPLLQPRK